MAKDHGQLRREMIQSSVALLGTVIDAGIEGRAALGDSGQDKT